MRRLISPSSSRTQRAAVSLADHAWLVTIGAREAAADVTKQFRFEAKVSGMPLQFTATKGRRRRALCSWMDRATASLPTPVSPRIRTFALLRAAISMLRRNAIALRRCFLRGPTSPGDRIGRLHRFASATLADLQVTGAAVTQHIRSRRQRSRSDSEKGSSVSALLHGDSPGPVQFTSDLVWFGTRLLLGLAAIPPPPVMWRVPRRGPCGPDSFLPVLRRAGRDPRGRSSRPSSSSDRSKAKPMLAVI